MPCRRFELAHWLGQLWWLQGQPQLRDQALDHAATAIQLAGRMAGYEAGCQLYLLFSRQARIIAGSQSTICTR